MMPEGPFPYARILFAWLSVVSASNGLSLGESLLTAAAAAARPTLSCRLSGSICLECPTTARWAPLSSVSGATAFVTDRRKVRPTSKFTTSTRLSLQGTSAQIPSVGNQMSLHKGDRRIPRSMQADFTALWIKSEDDEFEEDVEFIDEEDLSTILARSSGESSEFDYTSLRQKNREFLSIHELPGVTNLPKGIPEGFFVVKQHPIPPEGLDLSKASELLGNDEVERVSLRSDNMTLAVALMLIDPEKYPSMSRSRKACRKGYILLHRGPLGIDERTGEWNVFDPSNCIRARVKDRVYPNDVVCEQARMGNAFYPSVDDGEPPFELPVVYEDDHFAIVNKPAGINVNSHRKSGTGRMCVRAAAPYVLKPPRFGTVAIIRRPSPVHRIDKPTSGLLLIAKTKPAMVDLTRQFAERKIKKTYTAIVNGKPKVYSDKFISASRADALGVDVGDCNDGDGSENWQLIDDPLEGKSAVTVWRSLKQVISPEAKDGVLTLVELKPKTGRYHQLRRHMAMFCKRPLVGDTCYSAVIESHHHFKDEGLFLAANKVTLEHPYFNTDFGRKEWEGMDDEQKFGGGVIQLSKDGIKVLVHAEIELPQKFDSFLESGLADERE